ncbi:MAG: hypothetical protein M1837_004892 [Sclerophora amabilis]|nr:MAG: hypothetical protein M1837_004892 [Sclerophora amabilis]
MAVCKFWLQDKCKFGINCRNDHPLKNQDRASSNRSGGGSFGPQQQTSGVFARSSQPASGFGQTSSPAPTSFSAFGKPSFSSDTNGFGQPNQPTSNPFGVSSQPASNPFGRPSQPAFGQPSQPGSAFQAPSQPTFGQPAMPSSSFGAPSFPGFGQPPGPSTSNSFGRPAQPNSNQITDRPSEPSSMEWEAEAENNAPSGFTSQPPNNPFGKVAQSTSNVFENGPQGSAQFQGAVGGVGGKDETGNPVPFPVQIANPYHPESKFVHPDLRTYSVRDASNKLLTWHSKPVHYIDNEPCFKRDDDGTWEKIQFPDGPPAYNPDTEFPELEYDEETKEAYLFLREHGYFKDDWMPNLPPRREWCTWDF